MLSAFLWLQQIFGSLFRSPDPWCLCFAMNCPKYSKGFHKMLYLALCWQPPTVTPFGIILKVVVGPPMCLEWDTNGCETDSGGWRDWLGWLLQSRLRPQRLCCHSHGDKDMLTPTWPTCKYWRRLIERRLRLCCSCQAVMSRPEATKSKSNKVETKSRPCSTDFRGFITITVCRQ